MTRVGSTASTRLPEHDLDTSFFELVLGVLADVRLEHREQARACLDEDQPRRPGRHVAIVVREVASEQLGQGADALDPGRAAADDHDVERAVVDQ